VFLSGALGCKIIAERGRKKDAELFPLEKVFLTAHFSNELKV